METLQLYVVNPCRQEILPKAELNRPKGSGPSTTEALEEAGGRASPESSTPQTWTRSLCTM